MVASSVSQTEKTRCQKRYAMRKKNVGHAETTVFEADTRGSQLSSTWGQCLKRIHPETSM